MLTQLINRLKGRFTADWRQIDWQRTGLLVLLILAAASSLWQWAMPRYRIITENRFHPVPVIRGTDKIERSHIACPESGIIVLDKAAIAKKLDIDWLQGGDIVRARAEETKTEPEVTSPSLEGSTTVKGVEVTATGDLAESDNGYEAVSVIDMQTGKSQIVAREKNDPWFQFRNDGAIGVKYGINQRLTPVTDVYGRWDFLRVRDVYFGANGSVSTGGDAKLQMGVEYRW